MAGELLTYVSGLPTGAGKLVSSTYGSVTAGVGDFLSGRSSSYETEAPKISDYASRDALEQYKDYYTEAKVRASRIEFYASMGRQVGSILIAAIGICLGFVIGGGLDAGGALDEMVKRLGTALPYIGGMFAGAVGLFAGSHFIEQFAIRDKSNKSVEIEDFQNARLASLITAGISQEKQRETAQQQVAVQPVQAVSHAQPSAVLMTDGAEVIRLSESPDLAQSR